MSSKSNLSLPVHENIGRPVKVLFHSLIALAFTGMSAMAFDGDNRGDCYDYVVTECNLDPPCTSEELDVLLTSCDVYPESIKTPRPKFTAKPPSRKVVNSTRYKLKIKKLKADIHRK